MDRFKKKKIAAIIGVVNYLKEKNNNQEIIEVKQNIPSVWSNYSRQLIMSNRNMLQRRVIRR
jgi:hypothetical protein